MWGAPKKGAAANLYRQQEQFCSSLKDIDDSEEGWGDVAERGDSKKVGWGKANLANSQAPTTGWGANNTRTAIRGWGSSQAPAPPPDLTPKLRNGTQPTKVEQKSLGNSSPKLNGWGAPTQTSRTPKFQKEVKQTETTNVSQMERLLPETTSVSKGTSPSLIKASRQQPRQTDSKPECTETKPLTNGCAAPRTKQTMQNSPTNAEKTGSTQTKPSSDASTKPQSSQIPSASSANVSTRPRTSAATRTRDLYVPPRAKLAAAAASSTSSAPRSGRAAANTETSITSSTRGSVVTPRKTSSALPRKPPADSSSATPPAPPEKADPATNKRKDMFIVAQSESERFKELILLLENHPHRRPALLIVDKSRTDPVLLSALLCLTGLHASPTTMRTLSEPAPIRVICTDELNANETSAQLVVNVDMVSAFDQIGERMKFLEKNGLMKTFLVPAKDSVRAANLALMFRDCGLPVPLQLECFVPRDDE